MPDAHHARGAVKAVLKGAVVRVQGELSTKLVEALKIKPGEDDRGAPEEVTIQTEGGQILTPEPASFRSDAPAKPPCSRTGHL